MPRAELASAVDHLELPAVSEKIKDGNWTLTRRVKPLDAVARRAHRRGIPGHAVATRRVPS